MLRKSSFLFLLLVLWETNLTSFVYSEKILVSFMSCSKSHRNVIEPLLHELAKRGHEITMISSVAPSKSVPGIREITGPAVDFFGNENMNPFETRLQGSRLEVMKLMRFSFQSCHDFYKLPELQNIISTETFDLVFSLNWLNECAFGMVHHFNAPLIVISPQAPSGHFATLTGSSSPTSFVPNPMVSTSDKMTFMERVKNMLAVTGFDFLRYFFIAPNMEQIYLKYFPNAPSIYDIERNNLSLILSNGHFSLTSPRPSLPDMVDIGGLHCRPAEPLPKDLQDFLDGAKDGFILFSFGSIVRGNTMPKKFLQAFVNTFSKLKQRVVWKWESESMDNLPPNVKLGKWLPQQDILGHPNIKLFITHGGLLSTQEAVYHGVPLLGIPFYGDQDMNMAKSEAAGYALTLELKDLTEESLHLKIERVLNDTAYNQHFTTMTDRVRFLSQIFRDQPEKPLDRAVWWTEYVLRHKGAHHMRSPARHFNFMHYNNYDAFLFVATVVAAFTYVIYAMLKYLVRMLTRAVSKLSSPITPKNSDVNNNNNNKRSKAE